MRPGPPKQFDREEALQRAMELFWSQGYEKSGMSQLLDHMGIGRQSLYDTFGSKRELFLSALEQYQASMLQPVLEILEAPGHTLENLRRLFEYWKSMAAEHKEKGCLLGRSTMSFASSDEEVAKTLQSCFDRLEDALFRLFERARSEGEIGPGADSRSLARVCLSAAQGLALMGQIQEDSYVDEVLDTLHHLLSR